MSFRTIGVVHIDDRTHTRIEICASSHGIVYITGYRAGQIGERSISLTPSAAREASALLMQAAAAFD